jgi:hypothetical protein
MDDLELLRRMTGDAPIPDEASRARMRASLDGRIEQASAPKGRRSRSAVVAILIAAGVSMGTLAAAAAVHIWSEGHPVAISVLPGDHGENNSLDISNPDEVITSATGFEATVTEFAPAIRLPEGHDFTAWVRHVENVTDFAAADGGWRRFNLVGSMVFVADCQWGQHWVDASEASDAVGMSESINVLGQIVAWSKGAGQLGDDFMPNLVQQMRDGETLTLQQFLGVNCGHTGSVIGSPAQLDGFAQDLLTRALTAAQEFHDVGDTYSGFGVIEAEKTAPAFAWAAPDVVPAAGPGQPNIAVADGQRLVLTSESESGTIFCIEDDAGVTTYGRVAPGSGIDAGVVCDAAGWQTRAKPEE